MVRGLDGFTEFFKDFKDSYVIVGGVATFLILDELDPKKPKATKDIDMVLFAKENEPFIKRLKDYLREGKYKAEVSKDGQKKFFRFIEPKDETYPIMIELFVKNDSTFELDDDQVAVPIDLEKDIESLSALLLDEEYFELVKSNVITKQEVQIVSHLALIPLKAKAYLDIKARGERKPNWKKHRSDILNVIANKEEDETTYELTPKVKKDMQAFIAELESDLTPEILKGATGLTIEKGEIIDAIKKVFGL